MTSNRKQNEIMADGSDGSDGSKAGAVVILRALLSKTSQVFCTGRYKVTVAPRQVSSTTWSTQSLISSRLPLIQTGRSSLTNPQRALPIRH